MIPNRTAQRFGHSLNTLNKIILILGSVHTFPLQLARKSASSNPFASDFVANLSPKLFKRLDVVSKKTFLPQLMEILQPQDYPAASHNHNPLLLLQHLRQLPPGPNFPFPIK